MEFKIVECGTSKRKWASGLFTIFLFNYKYNGRSCDAIEQDGYWAYYDGKRLVGPNMYSGFNSLQDAIDSCEKHEISLQTIDDIKSGKLKWGK